MPTHRIVGGMHRSRTTWRQLALLPILLLLPALICSAAAAKTRRYTLTVQWRVMAPDGFARPVLTINKSSPGPQITSNVGDKLVITVNNKMDAPTSMHWHGILQTGTPGMDGATGISSNPIPVNGSFTYKFTTDEAGTYWYHAHMEEQYVDGCVGPLVVHNSKNDEDELRHVVEHGGDDRVIMLKDWYHDLASDLLNSFMVPGEGGVEPVPYTVLINGRGQGNCSAEGNCPPYAEISFPKPELCDSPLTAKSPMLRVINAGAFAAITLSVDHHLMRIVAVDRTPVEASQPVGFILINVAQRYDVMLCRQRGKSAALNKAPVWIRATMPQNVFGYDSLFPNASAILRYGPTPKKPSLPTSQPHEPGSVYRLEPDVEVGDELTIVPTQLLPRDKTPPPPATRNITLQIDFYEDADGITLGHWNNITFTLPDGPSLLSLARAGKPYPNGTNIIDVRYGEVIQLIINNHDTGQHPIHLHGHTFWVMATGPLNNSATDPVDWGSPGYDTFLPNPIARDTMTVNALSYMVLRFEAKNPGVWFFHCHIDWHLSSGLALAFSEAIDRL